MPNQISPGILTTERDGTSVVPAVATGAAGLAGPFQWGPCDELILVDNESELVSRFGEPKLDYNVETFYTAANFLAYANRCFAVRTFVDGQYNAISANATIAAPLTPGKGRQIQVKNDDHWDNFSSTDTELKHVARYPGDIANGLEISVCDSAQAYEYTLSTGITFGIDVSDNKKVATTPTKGLFAKDDIVTLTFGSKSEELTVMSVTSNTSHDIITFATDYTLGGDDTDFANGSGNKVERRWKYTNLFNKEPGQSQYQKNSIADTIQDEIHIVVIDRDGKFSGRAGEVLERWESLSRAENAKNEIGERIYYKHVINEQSRYIRITKNTNYRGATDYTSVAASLGAVVPVIPYTDTLNHGVNSTGESNPDLSQSAYDLFKNENSVDISYVMQGKGDDAGTKAKYLVGNICKVRRDCIATVSPAYNDVINQSGEETKNVIEYRDSLPGSSYYYLDSGYKQQYDRYNDVYVWVPLNGDVAGIMARSDRNNDPWVSPAGIRKGQVKNVVKLAWVPGQGERDRLYPRDVNPVVTFPGQGVFLYGDKTGLGYNSVFSRVGVRKLFINLRVAIREASENMLFEFNDEFTRARFRNIVEPYLRDVQGRRGITDFRVVCDERNNTSAVINRNEFIGSIFVKPNLSINFITLNFIATQSGVEFSEIVGSAAGE